MFLIFAIVLLVILVLCLLTGFFVFRNTLHRKVEDEAEKQKSQVEWESKFGALAEGAIRLVGECPPEKRSVLSADGLRLVAEYYPATGSHRYAICLHGYTSDHIGMRKFAAVFHGWGINVLLPDDRAHGESEGRWIGMGYLDSQDLLKWIEMVVAEDPQAEIFLMGQSMGGATVMMASALPLPPNVKFLVEDCGYTSVWDEMAARMHAMHTPVYPILPIASFFCRLIAGYSFREASSVKALEKNTRPILFIHGEKDKFVPYTMLEQVVEANKAPSVVLRVPEAGHSLSPAYAPDAYFARIREFVEQYMPQ